MPITGTQIFRTPQYPSVAIEIENAPGSSLFTTAAATSTLDWLSWRLSAGQFRPQTFTANTTTREPPSKPVGSIRNILLPVPDPDKTGTTGKSMIQRPPTYRTLTLPAGAITIKHFPRGQTPGFPAITPQKWLSRFLAMTQVVFSFVSSTDPILISDPHRPLMLLLDHESIGEYRLFTQTDSPGVPKGKSVPTWEELVVGLAMIMEEVIHKKRFEPFDAEIYKDDWLVAKVRMFYDRPSATIT